MERTAFVIYMIVLAWSILLFGAVHTYAYSLMTLAVLTASLLVFSLNIKKDYHTGRYRWEVPKTSLDLLFWTLLFFMVFQLISMPELFVKFLSPDAAEVYGKSAAAETLAAGQGEAEGRWFSLAPYAYSVRMSIIRWTVYGLFFLGLIQVLKTKERISLAISLILIMGCFDAMYGLIQTYSGSEHIWWFKKQDDYKSYVCGTYINRNHLAGFMEMGLLLAVAFAASLAPIKKKASVSSRNKRTLGSRISEAMSAEEDLTKRILIVFSGVVLGIGLIFSGSRGGMIAAAGGMLCMGILFMFKKIHRRNALLILILFVLIAAYSIYMGVEHPVSRFNTFEATLNSRLRLVKDTLKMFNDYRLTGVGVGNFQYVYPRYQSPEEHIYLVDFAHNDWVQFLAEAGIVGFLLLLVGMGWYLFNTLRLWKRRDDPFAVSLGAGAIGAIVAIAIHSVSDFNLHIPANFLILVAIMAIAYAALHLERHHRRERMNYRYYELPLKYRGIVAMVVMFGLIGWSGYATFRHFMAEAYCNTVTNSTLNRDQEPPLEKIEKAIWWDECNAEYWYKLGMELEKIRSAQLASLAQAVIHEGGEGDALREERQNLQSEIITAFEKAVCLNPLQAKYHLQLGWEYTGLVYDPDYVKKWLPAADICMERAAYFIGDKNPALHVSLGNYWVMRSKIISPADPKHQSAWERCILHYRKTQRLNDKTLRKEIRDYVWMFYPDEEIIRQVIGKD